MPREEGKGLRCWREIIWVGDSQKSNIDRTVDLTPNSVEWTTWALGELPNNGEVYYDRDLLKPSVRKQTFGVKTPREKQSGRMTCTPLDEFLRC